MADENDGKPKPISIRDFGIFAEPKPKPISIRDFGIFAEPKPKPFVIKGDLHLDLDRLRKLFDTPLKTPEFKFYDFPVPPPGEYRKFKLPPIDSDPLFGLDLLPRSLTSEPQVRPASDYEARLLDISTSLGFPPLASRHYAADFKLTRLLVNTYDHNCTVRLASVAHELGHILRFKEGKLSIRDVMFFNQLGTFCPAHIQRTIMREEVMAWRRGFQQLRKIGFKPISWGPYRRYMQNCLFTYRQLVGWYDCSARKAVK